MPPGFGISSDRIAGAWVRAAVDEMAAANKPAAKAIGLIGAASLRASFERNRFAFARHFEAQVVEHSRVGKHFVRLGFTGGCASID